MGGERGATMPTTSGVESERPWSDLSTRESKAVIEGILSRVPTPPRIPTELTSTTTTAKKKISARTKKISVHAKNFSLQQKKYPCTQKIFRSSKKIFTSREKKIYFFRPP